MDNGELGPKRSAFQIALGAGVVLLGLAAVVVALALTLDHYPVQQPSGTQAGTDRSSAVVAVLTPVAAAIAGIVGLYFGLSSTGSGRAQQLKTTASIAQSATEAATTAARTTAQVAQSATEVAMTAAQATSEVAQSASDAAQSATEAAKSASEAAQSASSEPSGQERR